MSADAGTAVPPTPSRMRSGRRGRTTADGRRDDASTSRTRRATPDAERRRSRSCGRASRQTGDPQLRERLILHYSPLVKYVAGRVGVGLPPNIEQADLVSYGIFGLIDAIEKFDLERAIKFETYAISRIRGAIIDELRAIDWIPRSVRYKAREVEKAYAALEGQLHRTPTEAEVADQMGIRLEDLHAIFSQVSFVNVVALDELLNVGGEKGDKLSLVDTLEDTRAEDPVAGVRVRGDEVPAGQGHQHAARAGEDRRHPLLLRGAHARGDRPGARGHRVADLPDAHEGRPPAARQARRAARLTGQQPSASSPAGAARMAVRIVSPARSSERSRS